MKIRHRTSAGNRRSLETHTAILHAAKEILVEEGYRGFSIEAIARRSGAGKVTIYRWWPDKTDLFMELYAQELAERGLAPEGGPVRSELITMIRKLWWIWRETPCGRAFRYIVAEAQGNPKSLEKLRTCFMPPRRAWVMSLLQHGIDTGELEPKTNLEVMVDFIFGFNWYHLLTDQLVDENGHIESMVDALLKGIQKKR